MKYKVTGYCLVPCEAAGVIEADSPEQAVEIAKRRFKQGPLEYIVSKSHDERSAFDWMPTAEPSPDGKDQPHGPNTIEA